MSRRMFVPFHGDGIISQFEGYEALEELDWDAYRAKYGNIQRLDRILRAEGDDPNRYKVAKQADTVMLFFLFSPDELQRLFERLGYEYRPDTAAQEHRLLRPAHLARLHAQLRSRTRGVLAVLDPESSWERFLVALKSDVGTSRAGPPRRAFTWASCPARSTSCSAATLGMEIRDEVLSSTRGFPARSRSCRSRCSSGGRRCW